jgi:hypothetical protein
MVFFKLFLQILRGKNYVLIFNLTTKICQYLVIFINGKPSVICKIYYRKRTVIRQAKKKLEFKQI